MTNISFLQKYLPYFLIIKKVLIFNQTTICHFYVTKLENLNLSFFIKDKIISWHPFLVRNKNSFYHFKGLKKIDYQLINFCLDNEQFGEIYNYQILKNYFNKNSFEI